jgi:hypothetical protein
MTKPVRMTHTEASLVLSNWGWVNAWPFTEGAGDVYLAELIVRNQRRLWLLISGSRLKHCKANTVAACIEVVERGRR